MTADVDNQAPPPGRPSAQAHDGAEISARDGGAAPRPPPSVQPEADARCVAAVLAGRRERFEELVERYQDAVFCVLRGSIKDAHAAEDAAQDVFVSAFTSLSQLRDRSLFFPWLIQIARRRAIQFGVRKARHPEQNPRPLSGREVKASAPVPAHERMGAVLEQVEHLPEPYRSTILLKYERNLTCEQIAKQEGAAVGTITSRLTRAMVMLRKALREKE